MVGPACACLDHLVQAGLEHERKEQQTPREVELQAQAAQLTEQAQEANSVATKNLKVQV